MAAAHLNLYKVAPVPDELEVQIRMLDTDETELQVSSYSTVLQRSMISFCGGVGSEAPFPACTLSVKLSELPPKLLAPMRADKIEQNAAA